MSPSTGTTRRPPESVDGPTLLDAVLERWNGETTRRDFLKTSGLFVLSFSAGGLKHAAQSPDPNAPAYPDPDFRSLDSWIVVHEDGTVTFYVGKTDGGQGTGTAFRQMMCDEMDVAFEKSSLVMGRTDITVDQGGSGGSDAVERDSNAMRRVAAEARRALLEMGSQRLGVPVEELSVRDGVIRSQQGASRSVT